MGDMADKIRENRLRRMADQQGYALVKSRGRDPHAVGHSGYMIVEPYTNTIVYGDIDSHQALTLDQVEAWLTRNSQPRNGEQNGERG